MNAVYIPTRDRPDIVFRAVRSWRKLWDGLLVVTVERGQQVDHLEDFDVEVLWLQRRNRGMGYVRSVMLHDAAERGVEVAVQADDDHTVVGSLDGFFDFATRSDVVGVGGMKPTHALYTHGTELSATTKQGIPPDNWLTSGSIGFQVFALNVQNALDAGGFNPKLQVYEDYDIAKKAVSRFGAPWFVSQHLRVHPIHPSKHMRERVGGGVYSLPNEREAVERRCLEIARVGFEPWTSKRWPLRFQWKRFYAHYLPTLPWPLENVRAGDEEWGWG